MLIFIKIKIYCSLHEGCSSYKKKCVVLAAVSIISRYKGAISMLQRPLLRPLCVSDPHASQIWYIYYKYRLNVHIHGSTEYVIYFYTPLFTKTNDIYCIYSFNIKYQQSLSLTLYIKCYLH